MVSQALAAGPIPQAVGLARRQAAISAQARPPVQQQQQQPPRQLVSKRELLHGGAAAAAAAAFGVVGGAAPPLARAAEDAAPPQAPEAPAVTQRVFFDITYGGEPAGRIVLGVFGEAVPKTAANFVALAKGWERGGYRGAPFHRIIDGFVLQGGDFERGDGRGGSSIYGRKFADESFAIPHFAGCLSMANAGPNTNGSQVRGWVWVGWRVGGWVRSQQAALTLPPPPPPPALCPVLHHARCDAVAGRPARGVWARSRGARGG